MLSKWNFILYYSHYRVRLLLDVSFLSVGKSEEENTTPKRLKQIPHAFKYDCFLVMENNRYIKIIERGVKIIIWIFHQPMFQDLKM